MIKDGDPCPECGCFSGRLVGFQPIQPGAYDVYECDECATHYKVKVSAGAEYSV